MRQKKPKTIPVRVQRLASACRGGQTVVLTFGQGASSEPTYCLNPSGKPVGQWTFRRALALGLISPVGDGLFPGAESQTYRAAL